MTDEDSRRPLADLWQRQPVAALPLDLVDLRRQAQRCQKAITSRNRREYAGCLFVVLFFGWWALSAHSLAAGLGPAMLVVGALVIAYRLHTRGRAQTPPPDALAATTIAFYRKELERQRDLLRSAWRWYVGPMIPGFAFDLAQEAITRPTPRHLLFLGILAAVLLLIIVVVLAVNWVGARKLDEQLRALPSDEPG
jgi:hypothetical protein